MKWLSLGKWDNFDNLNLLIFFWKVFLAVTNLVSQKLKCNVVILMKLVSLTYYIPYFNTFFIIILIILDARR